MPEYSQYRSQIKTGDLLAWHGTSIFSWVISTWTHSPYTHVGIAWVVGNRVLVLQADPGVGVDVAPLRKELPVYWIQAPHELSEKALEKALDKLKSPYSVVNAIRAGLGLHPLRHGYQCVQYANQILTMNGFQLDLPALTPKDLVAVVSSTFNTVPLRLHA